MNRRDFLRASTVVAALPLLLAGEHEVRDDLRLLTDAWSRARASGRALLVLVIPTSAEARQIRAGALGEALTWGGERVHAILGQVEVVAARVESLRTMVPQADDEGAWGWFVDPSSVPARVAAFSTVAASQSAREERDLAFGGADDCFQGPPALADACWQEHRRRVVEAEIARSDARIAPFVEDFEWAAMGFVGTLDSLDAPARAGAVRAGQAFLHGRLPGAVWETQAGCGSSPDVVDPGDFALSFGCGMGYIPAHSERFLRFLVPWSEEN